MKRTLLSTAICLTLCVAGNAHALTITITHVDFGTQVNQGATGSANSDGTGYYESVDTLFGAHWSVDVLEYFSGPGTHNWSGLSPHQGPYDYDFTLDSNQVAWGTYWDWSVNNDMAVLNIMSCTGFSLGDACTTQPTNIQAGPTSNSPIWHGYVSAVPIPATIWLMGSGILGLVGLARRKND